jgi:peptidoglycan/LPS O-acetylase OafA/YrhL
MYESEYLKFKSCQRFASLDGLRAVSVIAVVWHHTAAKNGSGISALIGPQGVQLFFAISGFLITTLLVRETERYGKIDFRAFYIRRTLRIFPLYFATLALYVLATTVLEKDLAVKQAFFSNLLYFATFTTNIFVVLTERVIFYFSWSVAAEEQYYLLWPLILLLFIKPSRAAAFLSFLIFACVLGQLANNKIAMAVPLPIMIGSLLAICLNNKKIFSIFYVVIGNIFTPIIFISIFFLLLHIELPHVSLISLTLVGLVGSCVIREDNVVSGILKLEPISYIGSVSYGIYMLHMLCKNSVMKLFTYLPIEKSTILVFALTLIFSMVVASVSFKYYETWFLKLKHFRGSA